MRFSIRDGLWVTAIIALIAAGVVNSRRQASYVRQLEGRTQEAEDRSTKLEQMMQEERLVAARVVQQGEQLQRDQYDEILSLRQMLKRSIHDQRDWFRLQVAANRIIAIGPATTDSPHATLRTVRYAEAATGLDARRLRHFMAPIEQLRPQSPRGTGDDHAK